MSRCPLPQIRRGDPSRAARPLRAAPRRWLRGAEPALPAAAAATVPPCSAKSPPPPRAALPAPPPAALPQEKAAGRPGLGAIAGRGEAAGAQLRAGRRAPAGTGAPPAPASKLRPERRLAKGRGRSFLLTGDDEEKRRVEHQVTEGAEEPPIFHRIYVGCGRGPGSGRSRARLNPSHAAGPGRGSFPKSQSRPTSLGLWGSTYKIHSRPLGLARRWKRRFWE